LFHSFLLLNPAWYESPLPGHMPADTRQLKTTRMLWCSRAACARCGESLYNDGEEEQPAETDSGYFEINRADACAPRQSHRLLLNKPAPPPASATV
jgi:hypothetical protein